MAQALCHKMIIKQNHRSIRVSVESLAKVWCKFMKLCMTKGTGKSYKVTLTLKLFLIYSYIIRKYLHAARTLGLSVCDEV